MTEYLQHTIKQWLFYLWMEVCKDEEGPTAAAEDNGRLFMWAVSRADSRYNVWSQECAGTGPGMNITSPETGTTPGEGNNKKWWALQ